MKNRTLLFIVIALISFSVKSQDIVDNSNVTINGVKVLGEDKSILTSKFGEPSKIIKDYSEADEENMYVYHYSGFEVYVINDLVDSFEIVNNNYKFTVSNIKIGDNISVIKNKFPKSYKERKKDYLIIDLKEADKFVSLEFNATSNNISKINIDNY